MPLAGTGQAAATLVKAAKDAVKATWLTKNRVLSPAEIDQMQLEVEAAGFNALFTHFTASAVVAGTATGALGGGPGVPIIGVIT